MCRRSELEFHRAGTSQCRVRLEMCQLLKSLHEDREDRDRRYECRAQLRACEQASW